MAQLNRYRKDVARKLCADRDQMRYVLTALASAIQERLGEDVILCPRKGKDVVTRATVLSVRFEWEERMLWQHYIFYGMPSGHPPAAEELLRVTLDVAHELGHLILDRGPGRMNARVGIGKNDQKDVREVEAEWFALCVLQMYGFLFPEK